MKKIISVIGTRPQFIKIFPICKAIHDYNKGGSKQMEHIIINTGQHFDANLSDIFIEQMNISLPKYNLNVKEESQCLQLGKMIIGLDDILESEKPDFILVYGDTNSTLAGALAAKKLDFKVAHVEAGLRSYNNHMQEEINRIAVDKISDILFCPTENAFNNLAKEDFSQNKNYEVFTVGDVMYDCFLIFKQTALSKSKILKNIFGTKKPGYILATIHRAENTDSLERLSKIMKLLNKLSQNYNIIFPMHPRTKKYLKNINFNISKKLRIIDPVSYFDILKLLDNSDFVITDSGGLQKEAYFSNKVCITLRKETEWIETLGGNCNFLVDLNYKVIKEIISNEEKPNFKEGIFGNGIAGKKIINLLTKDSK